MPAVKPAKSDGPRPKALVPLNDPAFMTGLAAVLITVIIAGVVYTIMTFLSSGSLSQPSVLSILVGLLAGIIAGWCFYFGKRRSA